MKRLLALFLVALLTLVSSAVMAQDDDVVEDDIIVIELPDVLIVCPSEMVLPSVRETAQLVIEFNDLDDVLLIPVGVVAEVDGVTTVTIGRLRLTCDSTESVFALVDRSPAVGINEPPPEPETVIGVAENQPGYLVVNTPNANVRSCDQPTCSQVALVHGGDFLVVIGSNGESDDRLWWYVQIGDVYGWIWDGILIARGDLTDVPVIETDGEPAVPTVYIGFSGNPIFNELSDTAGIVCNILPSENYPLLGRNADTSWVWIEATCLDGTTAQGWINADNVAIRNLGNVFVPILGPEGLGSSQ